jgi:hypothetical protein
MLGAMRAGIVRSADDKNVGRRRRLPVDRLLDQLDMEAAVGCGWWETDTAALVVGLMSVGPVVAVFAAIAQLLRDGHDYEVLVGDMTARAAFAVGQEWIDAGIDPSEVQGWLRAGCWKPTVARAFADAGFRPTHLLGEDRPLHWVDVPTPDGEQVPLLRAVAEEFVTVETAIRLIVGDAP